MPTPGFVANLVSESASDPMLILLTVTHADLPAPLRFVRNPVNITSRSNVYTAFPFELTLPGDGDGGARPAKIRIDNIDQQIIQTMRALTTPPAMLIEIVLASAPNTVEMSLPVAKVWAASGNRYALECELTASSNGETESLMQYDQTPSLFPALFN